MQRSERPETAEMPDVEDQASEEREQPAEMEGEQNDTETASGGTEAAARNDNEASEFDWWGVGVTLIIAAVFAITARLNAQPTTSFVPAAVLSATGCGLFITGMRKIRGMRGIGLREAALGGFLMALCQFVIALTYPGIFGLLPSHQIPVQGFLSTWGLIGVFAALFSLGGAVVGHLAFAPLRPMPTGKGKISEEEASAEEPDTEIDEEEDEEESEQEEEEEHEEVFSNQGPAEAQAGPSLLHSFATVLLIGLAPMVIGYLFAAAYDFLMGIEQFSPGIYPSLRVLSGLLPWQLPTPINLGGPNGTFILFLLLWRIPLFLSNAGIFDAQALEPYIFNGAALGLLLLATSRSEGARKMHVLLYLLLEALLGLLLALPANLWIARGLQGLLQLRSIVIPLRTLQLLDPLTFVLNIFTAVLLCVLLGLLVRRQHRHWTAPTLTSK